jgi:hypothetical protein
VSQVHDDLDAALAAFRTAFPSSKPRVTVSYVEKEVQLLLHEPENPSTLRPTGYASAKTLEEAATALRVNFTARLVEHMTKADENFMALAKRHEANDWKLRDAIKLVEVPAPQEPITLFVPKPEEPAP